MYQHLLKFGVLMSGIALVSLPVSAQQAAEPAGEGEGLPPVEIQQEQPAEPAPAPAAKKQAAKKKASPPPVSEPVPQAPPAAADFDTFDDAPPATANAGEYPPGGQGAAVRAQEGAASPIDSSRGIVPGNLEKYPGAANRKTASDIDTLGPRSTNDVLERIPGITIVNDDGFARHGGIGMRGSPARRSRKVLVLEDGFPLNMALYIDPSVHYVPPSDRVYGIEVLRGANAAYGPNNNHGVVNFVNLSPFGPDETEIEFSFGTGGSNTRHIHSRKTFGNVGVVASYSGANVDGTWDTERLRYNDFFAAVGWKGVNQDFKISGLYFRQRDNYDEGNLEGEDGDGEGVVEATFFNEIGRCKSCYNPGSIYNTYNADVVRFQAVHNYYFDRDTTLTSRAYAYYHRRDRYQNLEGNPGDPEEAGLPTVIVGDDIFVPEDSMLGRLRTYKTYGTDVRAEFANRRLFGITQDIQIGAKYEYNDFTNRNFFGASGEILEDGDKDGVYVFDRSYDAHGLSAFIQSVLHVAPELKVVPGLRVEHYRVSRFTNILTEEEGEGDEVDCSGLGAGYDECVEIEGFSTPGISESFDRTVVLPHLSFAWSGLYKSTLYGGYHRGLTMNVLREGPLPPGKEIGDNFQIGFRSTAIRGLTFDVAGFYSMIEDYQIKSSAVDATGNNEFSTADEVRIKGVEIEGRVDSQAFTGGPWNVYGHGLYTYTDATITEGIIPADGGDPAEVIDGNRVPELPRHVAALTLGLSHNSGFDISATYSYRGFFFTDEGNTPFGGDEEGEDGGVPDVWLLSAKASYKIPNTQATVFVHGHNLTDELYITDREDGIKPGQGRTVFGGMRIKF